MGITPTSDGGGYWLVGEDGGVYALGDATSFGSLPGRGIATDDVVGVAAPPDGDGPLHADLHVKMHVCLRPCRFAIWTTRSTPH